MKITMKITNEQKELYLILTGKWTRLCFWNNGKLAWYYKGGSWVTTDMAYDMEINNQYYDANPYYN